MRKKLFSRRSLAKIAILTMAFLLFNSGFFALLPAVAAITTITVTSPNGAETWGGTHAITWTTDGSAFATDTVAIYVCTDGDVCASPFTVTSSVANSGTYSWDTNASSSYANDSTNRIKITASGTTTPSDISDANFTTDNTAPSAPVISSIATDNYINNSEKAAVVIIGTAEASSTVNISLTGGATVSTSTTATVGGDYSVTANLTSLTDGTITPSVTATDAVNNTSSATTTPTAAKDIVAPHLNSVSWNDVSGDTGINATDTLDLTFSEAMATTTIRNDTKAHLNTDLGLSGSHTFDSTTIAWNPGKTVLTVTLGAATTVAKGDTLNPAASVTDPAGNADDTTAKTISDGLAPNVTAANISISGASGTAGVYKIGDTITADWNNSGGGDNNPDIEAVLVDFSAFGGPDDTLATSSDSHWTATYTIVAGSLNNVGSKNVVVTATDTSNNETTTTDNANATIDDQAPSGYTVNIDQASITANNQTAISFTFAGAEVGATYSYSINDVNSATPAITGNGTVSSATMQITGIDVNTLSDQTLTLTVYLTDVAGNNGSSVTDTVEKLTTTTTTTSSHGGGGSISNTSCANVTYSAWGQCLYNVQYRSVASKSSTNCSLTTGQQLAMSQSCQTVSLLDNSINNQSNFNDQSNLIQNNSNNQNNVNVSQNNSVKPTPLQAVVKPVVVTAKLSTVKKILTMGDKSQDVGNLQTFLIAANKGPAAQALKQQGATKFFGRYTQKALKEFQAAAGIRATGNLGPLTKAYLAKLGY